MSRPPLGGVTLPRPAPAADAGPDDEAFYDAVEARFRARVAADPVLATYLGIHAWDDRLPDGGRDHLLAEAAADRAHLSAVERLDPARLGPGARFERDLEIHHLRRSIFEVETARRWERHWGGIDAVGDALFLLFTRDFATPAERFEAIAGRLEALPGHLAQHRTRPVGPQVRLWQQLALTSGRDLPSLFDEILAAASDLGVERALDRRLFGAVERARGAIGDYLVDLAATLPLATDDWPLGRERYDELVRLRAFDDLDADAILEIGWDQLDRYHAARAAAASEIDPDAPELAVVERIKDDHAATFDEALVEYRATMARARRHLVEHDLVTVPSDERIVVVPTPAYLRNVMPFAAYYNPAPFDRDPVGTYVITPSVDGDPNAIREHYRASISNTSVHEAYPGHHLQLTIAGRHPSLTRLQVEAPEFVEGWGMYCEQMMREAGFDDGPSFRLALATDAIWRACRIILDVRMHRGELGADEALRFLVEHTRFERPNALAEINRTTSAPTYPLSYLLGKVLILGLREDERRRRGPGFRLRDFHDTLLRNGSLPISFHRRILAGEAAPGAVGSSAAGRAAARP